MLAGWRLPVIRMPWARGRTVASDSPIASRRVVQRLLWKELRQARPYVVLLSLAAMAAEEWASSIRKTSD